jgi:MFS family permease
VDDDSLAQGPSFLQRTLSSLRWRNFRLFFIGQTISQTGNWLTNVALTLLILHRTGSGVALGLLVACQYGPILVLSAWAGVIVDRTSKRNLLYVTQALEMCESLALAALASMHNAPLAAFYVIAVAGGTLLALDNPVRRSFVNEMGRSWYRTESSRSGSPAGRCRTRSCRRRNSRSHSYLISGSKARHA